MFQNFCQKIQEFLPFQIHGSWFDPSNPVVRYSGTLRDDLYLSMQVLLLITDQKLNPNCKSKHMKACAKKADLVLVIGTSLSGLASDCVPEVNSSNYYSL